MSDSTRLLVVSVGTDHHPFDRLMSWVDAWMGRQTDEGTRCVVQRGTSAPPLRASSRPLLAHAELNALMQSADAVVTHGGPASIMECRRAGRLPIVVPRRADLGEHVDDHQSAFTRRLATVGDILLAEDEESFHGALDGVFDHPAAFRTAPSAQRIAQTVERFGKAVEPLLRT